MGRVERSSSFQRLKPWSSPSRGSESEAAAEELSSASAELMAARAASAELGWAARA
jgi:hypothetical protein